MSRRCTQQKVGLIIQPGSDSPKSAVTATKFAAVVPVGEAATDEAFASVKENLYAPVPVEVEVLVEAVSGCEEILLT